jgi:hypothetical protein
MKKRTLVKNTEFADKTSILKMIIELIPKKDSLLLHTMEDRVLEQAIITHDKDFAELSIIAYSLRKLISKKHIYLNNKWAGIQGKIIDDLKQSIQLLEKNDIVRYREKIKSVQEKIERTDELLGYYVTNIVQNARVKLASNAYSYGQSAEQSADLLSADKEQVMSFIGVTKLSDEGKKYKSIKERVNVLDLLSEEE